MFAHFERTRPQNHTQWWREKGCQDICQWTLSIHCTCKVSSCTVCGTQMGIKFDARPERERLSPSCPPAGPPLTRRGHPCVIHVVKSRKWEDGKRRSPAVCRTSEKCDVNLRLLQVKYADRRWRSTIYTQNTNATTRGCGLSDYKYMVLEMW